MRFLYYFRLSESIGDVRRYNDEDNGYIDFGI